MGKAKKKQTPKPASKAPTAPNPQPVPASTAIATVEPPAAQPMRDQTATAALYPPWSKFDKPEKQTPNHRQRLFIDAYLADPQMNAGRAARGAGYRGVTAGCQLLKMPVVKAEIEKRLKRRRKRFELTADALLQELCAIAFLDPAEILDENGAILPLAEIPPHVRAAIKDISCGYGENADSEGQFDRTLFVKATFHEKSWAAQLLAKHLGLLADNSKQAGNGNGSHANVLTLEWDKLFEPEPTGADGIEKRLQEEEAKAGLRALPAPSPVVVDAVATPVVASKVKADGTNGKANGKPLGLSPRKTPAK